MRKPVAAFTLPASDGSAGKPSTFWLVSDGGGANAKLSLIEIPQYHAKVLPSGIFFFLVPSCCFFFSSDFRYHGDKDV